MNQVQFSLDHMNTKLNLFYYNTIITNKLM